MPPTPRPNHGIDLELLNWRSVVAPPRLSAEQTKALLGWQEILKARGWDDSRPAGAAFASMGTLAIYGSVELDMPFVFGFLGNPMRRYDYPVAPMVVGLILGPMAEAHCAARSRSASAIR